MSGTNKPDQGAGRSTLKRVLLLNGQTTDTDQKLDALLANDDIARVTQQLNTAVLNLDMGQILILERQLCGLIRTNPVFGTWSSQSPVTSTLKIYVEAVRKTTVTNKEVDDLLANDDIARLYQQHQIAIANNDMDQIHTSGTQLISLIRTNSAGSDGRDQEAARSELKRVLLIDRAFGHQASSQNTVTDEEIGDLLANDDIARVAQQLATAREDNDMVQVFSLFNQLKGLIRTHSADASGQDQRAARSILKVYVESVRKTTVTKEELDGLLANDEIARVIQQLDAVFENNEENQQQVLDRQLVGLIRANSAGADGRNQGKVREILKCYVEGVRKTTVPNKELDDLIANDDIARVTQQLITAITNKEFDQGRALSNQLIDLIMQAQRSVRSVLRVFLTSVMKITTTVTSEELDDLLTNDEIVRVTQQLQTALKNHKEDQQQVLARQLFGLIMANSTIGMGPAQGAAEASNCGVM